MFAPRHLFVAACLHTLANPATAQRRTPPSSPVPSPAFDTSLYNALEWREIGPFRGGRVTAVAGHAPPPPTVYLCGNRGRGWEKNHRRRTLTPHSDQGLRRRTIPAIPVAASPSH